MSGALKFVPDWFVTSKMIKRNVAVLYTDDNILYFNEDSSDVIFSYNEMGILSVGPNNINLDNTNYDEDDPETIIYVRLLAWRAKFKKRNVLKKEVNEELMLVTWQRLTGCD